MELSISITLLLLSWVLLSNHVSAERSVYIVHMDKPSMPKAFSSHHYWYSSILESANRESKPKLIYTYDNAFHGFSAVMSENDLQTLKKSSGFISAHLDDIITKDTTQTYKFLALNTAAGLWPASNYGKDVIIGVVDSGIWPESPSFKDDGLIGVPERWRGVCQGGVGFNSSLCNRKIIGARYFNGGLKASDNGGRIPADTARDDDGHGTHVASTAAGIPVSDVSFFGYAAGTARGIAPHARLSIYKVLWRGIGGMGSDILAGIDQAVADGVDILSISMSDRNTNLYENPLSIGSFGAREKGIVVCLSAGNRGPGFATLRSGIPWAVVVASGTVDRWFAGKLTLGNGVTINGWSTFPARAAVRNLPLVYNETLSACSSTEFLAEAPDNSVLVCNLTIENESYTFAMINLANSNIRAAIIIAEDHTIFRSTSFPHPGVVITPAEARQVVDYAARSSSPHVTIDFQQTLLGPEPKPAPALSDDSSRGPARSYPGILKPDIMAPGVLILAASIPHNSDARIGNNIDLSSDYVLLSGTSMACPHIAGIAALLKAAHPEWSPAAIQSAIMTTANPLDNTKKPIREMDNTFATAVGMGSGQVDPNRALDPGLIYDASHQDLVNLVCSMNFTREQTQTLVRSSYNCSNPSPSLNYPSFIAVYSSEEFGRTLTQRFRRTVTNVGSGEARYRAKVEITENTTVRVRPETLVFKKKYEQQSYSLSIRFRGEIESQLKFGSITWIDETGKYSVRSPIVVSPRPNDS